MAIVMGLDQHRAQITAEWIDTDTGELGRARGWPAHRDDVRKFFKRFAGQPLDVALEATTGWRFVVEELHAIGAAAHLAEPAETAARRGNNKRAKTDRADARHLRELLMIGRLPESWIPLDHLLDLRARVRLRHTLVHLCIASRFPRPYETVAATGNSTRRRPSRLDPVFRTNSP